MCEKLEISPQEKKISLKHGFFQTVSYKIDFMLYALDIDHPPA